MDRTERLFKIGLDAFLLIPLYFLLSNSLDHPFFALLISFMLVHTVNWVINGQIFVLFKNLKLIQTSSSTFEGYLEYLSQKIKKQDFILFSAVYGSLAREKLKETSDLDVRIIRKKGWLNGLRGCIFVMRERSRALLYKFPLDIYLLDDTNGLSKLDERKPIIIHDTNK